MSEPFQGSAMSEADALAYILLKSLYVFGIVCGLTPHFLLIAALLDWRRAKNVIKSKPSLRVPVGASGERDS